MSHFFGGREGEAKKQRTNLAAAAHPPETIRACSDCTV